MTLSSEPISTLYYILFASILIGLIILFCSGIMIVKKGQVVIIEKLNEYYKTYKSGVYYLNPFKYRRVGIYNTKPQEYKITINQQIILIKVVITDYQKYHYSNAIIKDVVNKAQESHTNSIEEFINALQKELLENGCTLIK